MKKMNRINKIGGRGVGFAVLLAVVAGWLLPVSAVDYVAHWDFGSDAQGVVDTIGNYDLVNSNGVAVVDGAAVFDGTSSPARSFVTRRTICFEEQTAYTIECWVKSAERHKGMIMELSENYFNSNGGTFMLYAQDGVAFRTSSNDYRQRNFSTNIFDNEWHHLAIIVNPKGATEADRLQFYVDRVLQSDSVGFGTGMSLKPEVLYIGSRAGNTLPFNGQIDDVRITAGVLSTSQFLQARSAGSIDVRAYWKFDDGNALADSSGNGNTLQGSQGVTFANGCASFNGTMSDVRTVNTLDLSAYKDVTVECFVRRHEGADAQSMILEHSNAWNVPQEFYLLLNGNGAGSILSSFTFSNYTTHNYYSTSHIVNAGWHHVAFVKDSSKSGSDACVRLYVDGIQQTTYDQSGSRDSSVYLRNDYLYIGSRNNSGLFTDADIDDVRVTAGVLQPGQFLRTRTGALEDVIAYWPFEKATNMLDDATGNGNVLTGTGVTVNGGAAVFDGTQSGFATLATLPLYAYRSMTVEWFMKSSMSAVCMVLETSPNLNATTCAFSATANEYAPAAIQAGYRTTLGGYNLSQFLNVLDGKWHHVALVYDYDAPSSSDTVRLYCDGIRTATRNSVYEGVSRHRSERLYIGSRGGNSLPFVGELDDIKITGRALAPAEFMAKRSKPPTGMAIFFR